jgi:hypothetical protein
LVQGKRQVKRKLQKQKEKRLLNIVDTFILNELKNLYVEELKLLRTVIGLMVASMRQEQKEDSAVKRKVKKFSRVIYI